MRSLSGIPYGQSLTYEVPVDLQWGTYWWHSHVGAQYVDGLRAPMIVHPPTEVHAYDEEYTIILSDWYNEQQKVLIKQFMNIYNPTGAEPVPNNAAIYVAQNGSYLPGFAENATMTFVPGKTYRLRIINQSAFAMFYAWLDGHDMTIIEADGTDTEPYAVDHLSLSVAQRYSVLVTAKNDTSTNYVFQALFDSTMFDTVPDDLQLNYTIPVQYSPSAPYGIKETKDTLEMTMDQLLVPTIVEEQLVATRNISLGVYFDTFDDGINRAAFNNITFQLPSTPSLFTELSMGNASNTPRIYGEQTHAYVLQKNEVIDLMIINWDANSHPFHLHGHKYQIVRVAQDVSSNDTTLNPPHTEGAANPMRRDTVVVPAGGAYNVRFVADNPGTWIFHCHIEWHLEAGLAVVFVEAPDEAQQTITIPQVMKDQCATLGIASTGNVAGKNSTSDFSGEAKGPFPQKNGWRPRAIGALAGTILAALFGMGAVVWYAFGGQLDAEDVADEVRREIAAKKDGGLIRRNVVKGWRGMTKKSD
ncbi:iron transport multicopper oxidase, partial [Phenoliferia sp. Uapishka_3]